MLLLLLSSAFAKDTPPDTEPVDPNRHSGATIGGVLGGIVAPEVGTVSASPCLGYRAVYDAFAVHAEGCFTPGLYYEERADGESYWNTRTYFGADLGAHWFPIPQWIAGLSFGGMVETQMVLRLGDALTRNTTYGGLVFRLDPDGLFDVRVGRTPQYDTAAGKGWYLAAHVSAVVR